MKLNSSSASKYFRLFLNLVTKLLSGIFILIIFVYIIIQLPFFQKFITGKAEEFLKNRLNTEITIGKIEYALLKSITISEFLSQDQSEDTLLYFNKLKLTLNVSDLFYHKIVFNSIEFDKVKANFNRAAVDTVWNYQFAIDAFNVQDTVTASSEEKTEWVFGLEAFRILNSNLVINDSKDCFELVSSVKSIALTLEDCSISSTEMNGVNLETSEFNLFTDSPSERLNITLKASKTELSNLNLTEHTAQFKKAILSGSDITYHQKQFNSETAINNVIIDTPWQIDLDDLVLDNINFKYDSLNEVVPSNHFNPAHLNIEQLNTVISSIYIDKNNLRADVKELTAVEGDKFELNQFSGKVDFNSQALEVSNLNVKSAHSSITIDFCAEYDDLISFYELSDKIEFLIKVGKSNLGAEDVVYFFLNSNIQDLLFTQLDKIKFETAISGTLANLNIKSLNLYNQEEPLAGLIGKISDIKHPDYSSFDIDLHTYSSLIPMVQTIYPSVDAYIKYLASSQFDVQLTGNISHFKLNSTANTTAGKIKINGDYINVKLPIFKLGLAAKKLNIGQLVGEPKWGAADFEISILGKGDDFQKMEMDVTGKINQIMFENKTYRKLELKGDYRTEVANIKLKSAESFLDLDLDVSMNFKHDLVITDGKFILRNIELRTLGITQEDIRLAGTFKTQIIGTSLDSIKINLSSDKFQVIKDQLNYEFAPSNIEMATGLSSTSAKIDFPFLTGTFNADYSIQEIQEVFTTRFLPKLIEYNGEQNFNNHHFDLEVTHLDPVIFEDLLIKGLDKLDFRKLKIAYNGEQDQLKLLVDVPHITYQDIEIDTLLINANSTELGFEFSVFLKQLKTGDLTLPTITTYGNSTREKAAISFGLMDDLEEFTLFMKTEIQPLDSGFQLHLLSDSLILGYKTWEVDKDNRIVIGDSGVYVEQLVLNNDLGIFEVKSKNNTTNSPIQINFQQLQIETLSKIFDQHTASVGGIMDGTIVLYDLQNELTFSSSIAIHDFTYGVDTVGNINLNFDEKEKGKFEANFKINSKSNDIKGAGFYQINDNYLNAKIQLERFDISSIASYTQGQIENLSGILTGEMSLKGPLESPSIAGQLNFKNTRFNTAFLGTNLHIENETLVFKNDEFLFKDFLVNDVEGNSAKINGTIGSNDFTSFTFNLQVNSDKFKFLNTKSTGKADELYFGQLYMSSVIDIKGNSNLPQIDARIKITEGSDLTVVVLESDDDNNDYSDIVTFVSNKEEIINLDSLITQQSKLLGVRLQANLELVPEAKLRILVDRDAGDYLALQGKADLSYTIDESGLANLSGVYEVTTGVYDLTFYSFLKKQFTIEKGSRIIWTGDPYDALLDAKAIYSVNTSALPLVESQLSTSDQYVRNRYKQLLPFIVSLDIGGQISSPDMVFAISLPEDKQNFQGGIIGNKLKALNSQPSELNKQVFSLLLFNRFIMDSALPSGGTDLITNTTRNSVSKLLTEQLNNLSDKYIKVVKIQMDLESFQDFSSGSKQGITDLKLALSKELFHERMMITIGGNVILEGDQSQNDVRNLAQDIMLEYRLDDDGTYRLKAFRKNEFDGIIDGEIIKTGVGLALSTEFNDWGDFLKELKTIKSDK